MSELPTARAFLSDERTQLQVFLDENRHHIASLLDGMTEEQARRRLVSSRTTLAGIVKHCTFAEMVWFQGSILGRSRTELGLPEDAGDSWLLDDTDTTDALVRAFRAACEGSDRTAEALALDDLAQYNRRGPVTLRWIYAHMVEELARHAGHGDILRELIADGREGIG